MKSCWLVRSLLATLLFVLGFTGAKGGMVRDDVPDSVVLATGANPKYEAAGLLRFKKTDNLWYRASCFAISKNDILCSAHALRASDIVSVYFYWAPETKNDPSRMAKVVSWEIHELYDGVTGSEYDIAIGHTTVTMNLTPFPLLGRSLAVGTTITLVDVGNYGTNASGEIPSDYKKRGGHNLVVSYGGTSRYPLHRPAIQIVQFDDPSFEPAVPDEYMALAGSSGGLGAYEENGTVYAASMMSYRIGSIDIPGHYYGDGTGLIDLAPLVPWIRAHLTPTPTTPVTLSSFTCD